MHNTPEHAIHTTRQHPAIGSGSTIAGVPTQKNYRQNAAYYPHHTCGTHRGPRILSRRHTAITACTPALQCVAMNVSPPCIATWALLSNSDALQHANAPTRKGASTTSNSFIMAQPQAHCSKLQHSATGRCDSVVHHANCQYATCCQRQCSALVPGSICSWQKQAPTRGHCWGACTAVRTHKEGMQACTAAAPQRPRRCRFLSQSGAQFYSPHLHTSTVPPVSQGLMNHCRLQAHLPDCAVSCTWCCGLDAVHRRKQ